MKKPYPGYKPYRSDPSFKTLSGPLYYLREVGYYLFSAFIVSMMLLITIPCLVIMPFIGRDYK